MGVGQAAILGTGAQSYDSMLLALTHGLSTSTYNGATAKLDVTLRTNLGNSSFEAGYIIFRKVNNQNQSTLALATYNGTSVVEGIFMDQNQNVGIGTNSPSYQLQLSTDSAAKPNGGSWANPSDRRLKKDIMLFSDGLAIVEKINPIRYRLNGKAGLPKDIEGIGVLADEIQTIAPYTVGKWHAKLEPTDTNDTELLDFNAGALTFVLINAVKEQQKQIRQLQTQIKELQISVRGKAVIN